MNRLAVAAGVLVLAAPAVAAAVVLNVPALVRESLWLADQLAASLRLEPSEIPA